MVTLCARAAQCKGTFARKNQIRNKAGQRASRQPFGKRRWKYPECKNGLTGRRNQSSRQQVCLRKKKTTTNGIGAWKSGQQLLLGSRGTQMEARYEMVSMDIANSRMWNIEEMTLWRGRPPLKRLKSESHA
jgi:hypothetical protein